MSNKYKLSNRINDFASNFVNTADNKIYIFTDFDGTFPQENKFKYALMRMKKNAEECFLIINTGRTPKDLRSKLEIPENLVDGVIGNNGATSPFGNKNIDTVECEKLLEKYISLGGQVEDIRAITTEGDIISHDNLESRDYYKEKQFVNYVKDENEFFKMKDSVTKLTLVADGRIIKDLQKYIEENRFNLELSIGSSKYRKKGHRVNRAMIDCTSKGCNKGIIIQKIVEKHKPKTFMVWGNDGNDLPALKYAIEQDAYLVLVESEPVITKKVEKELKEYAKTLGKDWKDVHYLKVPLDKVDSLGCKIANIQESRTSGTNFRRNIKIQDIPPKGGRGNIGNMSNTGNRGNRDHSGR